MHKTLSLANSAFAEEFVTLNFKKKERFRNNLLICQGGG